MAPQVKPIPEGYHSITPYLIVDGAASAIEFYKKVFGATERFRMPAPGGRVGHAEISVGDSIVMLADENLESHAHGPRHYQGSPISMMLYVEDVDAVFASAIAAGSSVRRPVSDQFYGDRLGMFEDPFGHVWAVATHTEDVSPEEMEKRAAAAHPA